MQHMCICFYLFIAKQCLQYMLIPSFLSSSLNVIGDYVLIFVKISVCVFIFMVSLSSSSSSQCIRRYLDRVWSPASIDYLDDPPVVIKEHTSSPPPPPPAQFNTSDKSIEIKLNKQGGTSLGFSIAGGKGTVHIVTYTHTVTHTHTHTRTHVFLCML